jgi:hypothetical protein
MITQKQAAPPALFPDYITLTRSISVPTASAELTFRAGTKLKVITKEGARARVLCNGIGYWIPTGWTDL